MKSRARCLRFLPGAAEIRRTGDFVRERITDPAIDVVPLYGALDADVQDRAIAPPLPGRRKIVLATSIAETSLTIEGVRVVVDSGLSRVPRFEPAVALTRLETVRVSRASADQRRGRAGRTEPGVCYRLWDEPETRSLVPFAQPEILAADLSSLVLDLAVWGVADPGKLAWLDPAARSGGRRGAQPVEGTRRDRCRGTDHAARQEAREAPVASAARRDDRGSGGRRPSAARGRDRGGRVRARAWRR